MLAIFNEILHTVLVVRVPAGWVDTTKLAIIQEGLRLGVDYALDGAVLAPIRGAFSLSFDRSWIGGRSQNMRLGGYSRTTYFERDARESSARVGPYAESFPSTLFRNPACSVTFLAVDMCLKVDGEIEA